MKKLIFFVLLGLLSAGAGTAQTIVKCPQRQKACFRSEEVARIATDLSAPGVWTIIPIADAGMWQEVCAEHRVNCQIPAFTELESQRTYLNVVVIWNRSAEAGIRAYLKHELGHIYTQSTAEKDADAWAKSH